MSFSLGGLTINNPLAPPAHNTGVGVLAPGATSVKDANGNVVGVVGPKPAATSTAPAATPSPAQQPSPGTPPAPVQSGSSGVTYADKSNDIAANEAGLKSVDASRDTALGRVGDALNTIMGRYDTEANAASTEYGSEGNANQSDLQQNKQASLQNAVRGRQGLYGTLASLGALSGTGLELANRAVQEGANEDLATAGTTYAKNQNALDSSYNQFKLQDAERRQQAQKAADNDKEQALNDYYKNEQSYLKNLGDDYQAEGNIGKAKDYYGKLSALFPQIAQTNVPAIDIGYSGSAYTAPTLASYLGRANNTTVQSTPGTQTGPFTVPGLLAVNKKQAA